ncbi:ABC transporter substrate-binding protein [Halobacterium sp. CBA1126]|uniref:ABC transporter substrate-binding protein n=1 Tax=Halobacterium sp. CBA1126 TaxID=2668074 RepID=UPI0012F9DEDE|nr:ABC transporter substrate-binding protein [Halobacterium sp. CBA1126]MUV59915.1 ABC transporter substrate-binding protein [Halobacterium sp. CBA1126]
MSDQRGPFTRRQYLKGTSAAAAAGLLAGCASPSESGDATESPNTDAGTTNTTTVDTGTSASLAPVGEVSFDQPPEDAFVLFPQYADMAVALGHGDAVNSIYVPEMSGTTMNHYYERLDGVSFEWEGLPDPFGDGIQEEQLYSLDSDVHFLDPAYLVTQDNWSAGDVEDIASNVGPWFGNFYSGTHAEAPEQYRDAYDYYTLWELFGHVADVFGERERAEALREVHDDLIATIEADLPPEEDRPTAVRATYTDGSFYTYHLNKPGYWLADTRPLAADDAFADEDWSRLWGTVGYETMLEADPDVILHLWGATPNYDMESVREQLRNNETGGRLSAVENDRVYASGMRYQGPLMNLFQLEMTAKQLYPDVFGEWPEYEDGDDYPEIPEDERLFDRERVAGIVTDGA